VRHAERHGQRVTYRSIAAAVGRSASTLQAYQDVRAVVESSPNNPRNRSRYGRGPGAEDGAGSRHRGQGLEQRDVS
jgi:hypothetical protein